MSFTSMFKHVITIELKVTLVVKRIKGKLYVYVITIELKDIDVETMIITRAIICNNNRIER